jgi:hypothetical protein
VRGQPLIDTHARRRVTVAPVHLGERADHAGYLIARQPRADAIAVDLVQRGRVVHARSSYHHGGEQRSVIGMRNGRDYLKQSEDYDKCRRDAHRVSKDDGVRAEARLREAVIVHSSSCRRIGARIMHKAP